MFRDLFEGWHIVLVLLVVLLLFGSTRLPAGARALGRSLRIFKSEVKGLHDDDATPEQAAATPPAVTAAPVAVTPVPSADPVAAPPATASPATTAPPATLAAAPLPQPANAPAASDTRG